MGAIEVLERLRRALTDEDDPDHQTVREAVEATEHRGPVARLVESVKVQDPSWSMLGVDELAAAARKAGLTLDDIDLALATLYLESEAPETEGESAYTQLLQKQREREAEAAKARAERLQGPHIQFG